MTSTIIGEAVFSPCGQYRYLLKRRLSDSLRKILWVLLNPSTATADTNDPTITKCSKYSTAWGYGLLSVVNIFGLRSTDPKGLKLCISKGMNPIGESESYSYPGYPNDQAIIAAAQEADMIICAWGRHGDLWNRGRSVAKLLVDNGVAEKLYYIKLLEDNTPGHPLYLKDVLVPQLWNTVRSYAC